MRSDAVRIILYGALCMAASLGILWILASGHPFQHSQLTVFDIPDFLGPVVFSLVHGHGLTFVDSSIAGPGNQLTFHAARMPLPIFMLAGISRIVGTGMTRIFLVKVLVSVILYVLAFSIVQSAANRIDNKRVWIVFVIISLVSILPTAMSNTVLLGAEEGFSSPFLALASAFILFPESWNQKKGPSAIGWSLAFGISTAALYLCKSSMVLVCILLAMTFFLQSRRLYPALFAVLIPLLAMAGWMYYTGSQTGKVALGTSLDGYNLYKGNNADILSHYPPPKGSDLDLIYATLFWNHGFENEWQLSDWGKHQALLYIREHRKETLSVDLRKADVILFSLEKVGTDNHPEKIINAGRFLSVLASRLVLWTSLLLALYQLFLGVPRERCIAGAYLALIASASLPYMVGFALTRHASILYLPAAIMLARQCLTLVSSTPGNALVTDTAH